MSCYHLDTGVSILSIFKGKNIAKFLGTEAEVSIVRTHHHNHRCTFLRAFISTLPSSHNSIVKMKHTAFLPFFVLAVIGAAATDCRMSSSTSHCKI